MADIKLVTPAAQNIYVVIADDVSQLAALLRRNITNLNTILKDLSSPITFKIFLSVSSVSEVKKIKAFAKDPFKYGNKEQGTLPNNSVVLVLTDNNMPSKDDGLEVARDLRSYCVANKIPQQNFPIIIVSANVTAIAKIVADEKLNTALLEKGKYLPIDLYRTIAQSLAAAGITLPMEEIEKRMKARAQRSPSASPMSPSTPISPGSASVSVSSRASTVPPDRSPSPVSPLPKSEAEEQKKKTNHNHEAKVVAKKA